MRSGTLRTAQHPFELPRLAPPRKCPDVDCFPAPPRPASRILLPTLPHPKLKLFFLCPAPKQKKAAPCIPGILAHNPGRLWPSASKSLNHRHSFIICGKRDASYSPIDARSMRAFWKTDVEYSVVTPWAYRRDIFQDKVDFGCNWTMCLMFKTKPWIGPCSGTECS